MVLHQDGGEPWPDGQVVAARRGVPTSDRTGFDHLVYGARANTTQGDFLTVAEGKAQSRQQAS